MKRKLELGATINGPSWNGQALYGVVYLESPTRDTNLLAGTASHICSAAFWGTAEARLGSWWWFLLCITCGYENEAFQCC